MDCVTSACIRDLVTVLTDLDLIVKFPAMEEYNGVSNTCSVKLI